MTSSIKLFIVSVALGCFVCIGLGCNSSALRSTSASVTAQTNTAKAGTLNSNGAPAAAATTAAASTAAQGKTAQSEYKLASQSKKQPSVTFSHDNHTNKNYSVDGTKPIGCVECHHTEMPAAEVAKHAGMKTAYPADRTATLTAESAKDAKTPDVQTCWACHARGDEKPKLLDASPEFTPEGESDPMTLNAEEAFHRNCIGCHTAATAKRKVKAPANCAECHK